MSMRLPQRLQWLTLRCCNCCLTKGDIMDKSLTDIMIPHQLLPQNHPNAGPSLVSIPASNTSDFCDRYLSRSRHFSLQRFQLDCLSAGVAQAIDVCMALSCHRFSTVLWVARIEKLEYLLLHSSWAKSEPPIVCLDNLLGLGIFELWHKVASKHQ